MYSKNRYHMTNSSSKHGSHASCNYKVIQTDACDPESGVETALELLELLSCVNVHICITYETHNPRGTKMKVKNQNLYFLLLFSRKLGTSLINK